MIILFAFLYCYVFWLLYILVMGLYRASLDGRLTGLAKWLAYPVVALAILIDIICNITIASVLFLELPKELLVTSRLSRYINVDTGWRKVNATWLCNNLLDYFDPSGTHCK
jgi:hypothetical protein